MSQHATTRRALLEFDPLEDRSTPSALLGDSWGHAPAPRVEPRTPALTRAAHTRQHGDPIKLSAHVASDGSGGVSVSGAGSGLGRYTGTGTIKQADIDPIADRVSVSGKATLVVTNGDRLFITFSVSGQLSAGVEEELISFTGGTGRFAGASGHATLVCHTVGSPSLPLTFACNGKGSGTLILAHH